MSAESHGCATCAGVNHRTGRCGCHQRCDPGADPLATCVRPFRSAAERSRYPFLAFHPRWLLAALAPCPRWLLAALALCPRWLLAALALCHCLCTHPSTTSAAISADTTVDVRLAFGLAPFLVPSQLTVTLVVDYAVRGHPRSTEHIIRFPLGLVARAQKASKQAQFKVKALP